MKKTNLVLLIALALLIVGAIFVSANFSDEKEKPQEIYNGRVCGGEPQQTCNSGTCDFQCNGDCGIPNCGCGR